MLWTATGPGGQSSEDREPESPRRDARASPGRRCHGEGRQGAAEDESGWEASSTHLESDQRQTGALQGGREGDQRRQGGSRVWRPRGPLLSPRLGRARPRSQGPTSGFRECPIFPASQGGKVKSGRSKAFFKHALRLCISRKTKLSHLGERWKNTQRSMVSSSHSQNTSHQPTASPPHDHVCLSPSALPSPTTPAFTEGSRTRLSRAQEACVPSQEASQQPLRPGPQFPHLQDEGFAVYQGLENCLPLIGIQERKMRSKSKRLCT